VNATGFGDILARYRVDCGLSQSKLAEIAGLSVETIGALERGTRKAPYRATVDALAGALGLEDAGRLELLAAADRSRARTNAKDAPAAVALSTLPRQLTRCIGRSQEISDILDLLSETRIATITGPAGIGKTRVLFEVAERLPSPHREAVRFVDLTALDSSDYLLSCIATSCGSPAAAHFGTIDDLAQYLRPQRLLLLLDNCEHIIDDVALAVASILRMCPNIAFLATSRARLAVSGESIYRLPSLSADAALDLMLDRISLLDADFTPSDDDVSALAAICSALDRIPLAIELAAARVPTLGPRAVRDRLKDGLALAGGSRDLPYRQRTMVAAIAWSYSLLEDPERSIMARLSVFSGGFTLESAASVCGTTSLEQEQVPDVVLSLVDNSLVNAHVVVEGLRYTMLEMIRAFARERLVESAGIESTMQRHAEWCGSLAAEVTSTRDDRTPAMLRRYLEPELNNVRSALQWSLGGGRDPVLAGRIVAGLRYLWQPARRNAEGVRWAQATLAQLDERQVPEIVSGVLNAIIQSTRGVSAGPWLQRARALAALTGDQKKLRELEHQLAFNHFLVGEITEADEAAEREMALVEQQGLLGRAPHAALLSLRVWIRVEQGRLADALSDVSAGEAIHVALGEPEPLNWWLSRAYLSYAGNDGSEALRLTTLVIDRISAAPAGFSEELLAAYAYLALFHLSAGNMDAARVAAREVLMRTRERTDYWPYTSIALLAVVSAHRGQVQVAARLLGFLESWHRGQPYLPTIAQRRTLDQLRSVIAGQIADDAVEAFAAEGALMGLPVAIESALAI
jgi:predicted ATPase/DNA-binding XRE family transcriptional regulator